jgi:hypothetical protein
MAMQLILSMDYFHISVLYGGAEIDYLFSFMSCLVSGVL